ncbi:hypothetical protein KIPB_010374, partial [Kipferlia bialata]|eukprot:g10374.t1
MDIPSVPDIPRGPRVFPIADNSGPERGGVYEPEEDTYFLFDAVHALLTEREGQGDGAQGPAGVVSVLEVGPGSGCLLASLGT